MAKKLILTKECVHLRICMSNLRSEMNFPTYGILLIVKTLFGGWFFRNSFNHPFEFKNCGIFFGVKKKSHFLASNHQKHVHVDVCFSKFLVENPHKSRLRPFYVKMADAFEDLATKPLMILGIASMFC